MEQVEIATAYETKVWVEGDMVGGKHVMVQHQVPGFEPFCYCSFHYDYRYTDNASIRSAAESMAMALGAKEPVEHRAREWKVPNVQGQRGDGDFIAGDSAAP